MSSAERMKGIRFVHFSFLTFGENNRLQFGEFDSFLFSLSSLICPYFIPLHQSQISNLEKLAQQYDVRIIFTQKFHFELSCIEGLWAHQKRFVRQNTDQTIPTIVKLMKESRVNFIGKNVAIKLFRRFWRTLAAYERGDSYEEILKMYFSALCRATIKHPHQVPDYNCNDCK